MNIRTKVISTIIAMVCSLSVSATGIAAIMLDFPIKVAESTRLTLGEVQGDLVGRRKGANNFDYDEELTLVLFKNGEGVKKAEMDLYCQNASFSNDSTEIEYVMKFSLAQAATNGVLVKMTYGSLTNHVNYEDYYQYSFGKEEPDWSSAPEMVAGESLVVSHDQPYLYLRAAIVMKQGTVARLDGGAIWSFSYDFTGIAVESNAS